MNRRADARCPWGIEGFTYRAPRGERLDRRSAGMVMEGLHNMALIKAFMERLANGWKQRQDCYNGRHKLRAEKVWKTDNLFFLQAKCKRCGVRKVTSTRLED